MDTIDELVANNRGFADSLPTQHLDVEPSRQLAIVTCMDSRLDVFAALGLDENDEERRLRHAACLLADIGWRAHPEYRGEQSLNLIAHAAFIGIDHPGRAYLALANFYRHEGLIDEKLSPRIREIAPTRLMERARALGATLRVAYLISGAMPGVVGRTRIEPRGKQLTLVLPRDLGPLGGARVVRRLGQLAKMAGMEGAVAVE